MKQTFTLDTSKVTRQSDKRFILFNFFLSLFRGKTKDEIFFDSIKRAFSIGKIVRMKDIHWNDALKYAEDQGTELITLNHMISFTMFLNNEKIYILFAPVFNGGVYISAYNRTVKNKTHSMTYMF